jgi:DNA repair photolyase
MVERAIINTLKYPCYWKGWELDMMQGCDIGCIYCSLSANKKIAPLDISDILNSPEVPEGIYLSPNSDPFSELAKDNTHRILANFLPLGTGIATITKRRIPEKTIKLMARYPDLVSPSITLCRLDQEMNGYIEKNAATTEERLDTIKQLADAGLRVSVRLTPLFPVIDDDYEALDALISSVSEAGAIQVKVGYAVVRDALVFRPIIKKMTQHPQVKESWKSMTETIDIFKGKGNVPPLKRRLKLYRETSGLTKKYGLNCGVCSLLDLPLLQMEPEELGFEVCTNALANMTSNMIEKLSEPSDIET